MWPDLVSPPSCALTPGWKADPKVDPAAAAAPPPPLLTVGDVGAVPKEEGHAGMDCAAGAV